MSKPIEVAKIAIKNAGGELKKLFWAASFEYSDKGKGKFDIATEADKISEEHLISVIERDFPNDSIYSEEAGKHLKNENLWIIDPLDGTSNFICGIPLFAIAITYISKGMPEFCMFYYPAIDKIVYGKSGKGAFIDGKKFQTDRTEKDAIQIVSFIAGYKSDQEAQREIQSILHKNFKRILSFWCPSYDALLISQGKIDAIVYQQNEIEDQLPGVILAREAGCIIKTPDNKEFKYAGLSEHLPSLIVARNDQICNTILELLRNKIPLK